METAHGLLGIGACFLVTLATWSIPIWRAASCVGSTSIRTANFCAPKTFTPATPLTIDNRCASTDSAY